MEKQNVGLKSINSLGYNVIATVYQTAVFKTGIKFDDNGKLLITHEGRVICSFHAERSESEEGKVSAVRPGILNNVLKQAGLR